MSKLFTGIINEEEVFGASMSNGKSIQFINFLRELELSLNIKSGISNEESDEYFIQIDQFMSFFDIFWKTVITINENDYSYTWSQYAVGMIENITDQTITKFDTNNKQLIPIKYKNT